MQERILSHICLTHDAGYDSLVKDKSINRDRATIIQALRPLTKKGYISKSDEIIQERNIRIVFRPTPKGIFYALAFLGSNLETIIRAQGDGSAITSYTELLAGVVDIKERDNFLANSGKALLDFNLFDNQGELKARRQELFNIGLLYGLTGVARSESPNSAVYFAKFPQLTKILTQKERKQVKRFYNKASLLISKAAENLGKEL